MQRIYAWTQCIAIDASVAGTIIQIVEGDKVVTRWTGRGNNTGSLFGMPSTGKPATVTGIQIDRIADGKIAETWVNFDGLGMLQQLGVIPSMG